MSRTFLLWFFTTVLIAMFMAACPSFAFAEDEQVAPQGTLTLDASQEDSSAIPQGAITLDPVATDDVVTDASTNDLQNESMLDVSQESNKAEETAEANAELASDDVLAKNQTAEDSAQQGVAEEHASIDYPDTTVDEETPASSDEAIQEPIVNDAPANAPPAVDASNPDQSDAASTDSIINNNAQSVDGTAAASNGLSSSSASIDSIEGDSNELSTASDLSPLALPVTINLYFYDTFEGSGTSIKQKYVGPSNDYIYDTNGNYMCGSSEEYPISFSGTEVPTTPIKRYGDYNQTGWYIKYKQNNNYRTSYFSFDVINTRVKAFANMAAISDISLHAAYTTEATTDVNYRDLLTGSYSAFPDYTKSGVNSAYVIPIPETPSNYPDNFAGWYFFADVDLVSGQYQTNSSSQALTGSETIWDVLKRVRKIQAGQPFDGTNWTFLDNSTYNPTEKKFAVVAAYGDVSTTISYTVNYTNTNGSGVATSETKSQTHGTGTGQNQTAIAEPAASTPWTTPTETGYDFTFNGWNTKADGSGTSIAAAVGSTPGGSFANIELQRSDAPTTFEKPADGKTYVLYAMWTKSPQTYTVVYNSGGWQPDSSEADHLVVPTTADLVKDPSVVWGTSRTGYQFDGWAKSSSGSAEVNVGASLVSTFSPVKGQTYTLYAKWTKMEYTIILDYDGATTKPSTTQFTNTVGATSLSTMTPTADIPVYNDNLKKTGFVFDGWSEGGTKVVNADNSIIAGSTLANAAAGTNHTLKAIWYEIKYTINWYPKWTMVTTTTADPEGDTSTSGPYTYTAADSVGLSAIGDAASMAPLKADVETTESGKTVKYTWAGWYINGGGSIWKLSSTAGTAIGTMSLAQAVAVPGAAVTYNYTDVTKPTATIIIFGVWKKSDAMTITYIDEFGPGAGLGGTSATVYNGDPYRISYVPTNVPGYTFAGWKDNDNSVTYTLANIQKTADDETNKISSVTKNYQLTAIWNANTVNFKLTPGATDSTINLHKNYEEPNYAQASVGETVNESVLTSTTPTRNGYDFAGWKIKDGTTVIVGPTDAGATYKVKAEDAPSDGTIIELVATWTPWTYTVRYFRNEGTDTTNAVTVYLQSSPDNWTSLGGTISADPYVKTTSADASETGWATPGIILTRDYYEDRQLVKWAAQKSDGTYTSAISDDQTLGTIYGLTNRTDRVIDLYAIWNSIKYTVNYAARNSNGTVTPLTETVDLAIGKDSDVTGSTATATASGYELAIPTWTDVNGDQLADTVNPVSTVAQQATYKPSVAYLRSLYRAVPSSTTCTFYANFTEREYTYKVQAFMQKGDGTWDSTWTSTNDYEYDQLGTTVFKAKLNSTVSYDKLITGTTVSAVNGKTLADLALIIEDTDGVKNEKLYTLDTGQGTMNITISANTSDNIIKLYYKRVTYQLVGEFKTKEKSTSTAVSGVPAGSGVTTSASDHLNDGTPTTTVRWGESVKLTTPAVSGYTFAWAVTSPTGSTSSLVQPTSSSAGSFVLNATDMDKIVSAGTKRAVLTGTFTGISYTITLIDGLNSMKNWDSTAAGTALNSSAASTTTTVTYNDTINTWLPKSVDRPNVDTWYLAGWEDADNKGVVIAPDSLRSETHWTKDKTYTAVWKEKVLITYDPGDKDSYGNSKAAWTSQSKSFTNLTDPGSTILSATDGAFRQLVGSMNGDLPLGADGWEFDYWTVDGDTGNYRYGQTSAIPVSEGGNTSLWYLDGDTSSNGITLSRSWKFIAHWKPMAQKVLFVNQGQVVNNNENTNTVTTTLQNVDSSGVPTNKPGGYKTDDEVDLSQYEPLITNIPAGYELAGWRWVNIDANGTRTEGTYTLGTKFHVKNGINSLGELVGSTTLNPYFNEKTVTFKYEIASDSTGRGTVDPVTSDTVFAVTHNGITEHTATTSNADAYKFVNWTYNGGEITADSAIDSDKMVAKANIVAGTVLEGDRTYYANFSTIQYKLKFAGEGTDGTKSMGSVTASGTGVKSWNGFLVDWNTTIPSGGIVTVEVPIGYELDGWLVSDGPSTPQTFSGANSNLQGVYNYVVTREVTLTAHFKESDAKDFTVNYNYDPYTVSLFTGSESSRAVAWGETIYPSITVAQPGFTFGGWYIDREYSETVAQAGDKFGKVYERLRELGKTAPNWDPDSKSITIYGKWTAESYSVAYDLYGNVANDTSTSLDDVQIINPVETMTGVGWNDLASTFKKSASLDTFLRPGYTLVGWSATYTAGGVTTETSSDVKNSDTYGVLAGNLSTNKLITLHAIWESAKYTVEYVYDDKNMTGTGTATPSMTVQKGWAEQVDYYTLGAAKTYPGYKFNGYTVSYTVLKPTVAPMTGDTLTEPKNTTIRDMVGGDADAIGSAAVIRLKATWTKESSYVFQDRLIHLDGTSYADMDVTSPVVVPGNTEVKFSENYGSPKTKYDGYDFDNFVATNPNWSTATTDKMTITEGQAMIYYVYYLERSYTIDFYKEQRSNLADYTPTNYDYKTEGNAWESAAAKLPAIATPSKPGYTFDGWYLTRTGNPDDGVKLDGSNSIKATLLFGDGAPASSSSNANHLIAVAKWIEDTVTIQWDAAANGTTNPAPGSVTYGATETPSSTLVIEGVPVTGGDYVFEKWTYEYVDPSDTANPNKSGDVTAASPFATLSGTDGYILTPTKWAMHTGEDAVWHDIKFTAHFALGSALMVKINYHYEDADETSTVVSVKYPLYNTVTKRDAVDQQDYIVIPEGVLDGYTLNEGLTKSEALAKGVPVSITTDGKIVRMYDFNDSKTQEFDLYFDADEHTVTYKYVVGSSLTEQTDIPLAPPLTDFNNGTFKTGQTHTVSADPTLEGWTFTGWFLSTDYNGVDISGTDITVGKDDIVIVGTWSAAMHHISFINSSSAPSGTSVTQIGGGYTAQYGSMVKTATPKASGVTGDAASLEDLDVTFSSGGQAYTVTGWDVLINGVKVGETLSYTGPLTYVVKSDVTFQAVWSPTYAVTYTRGAHGNFTETGSTQIYVEFSDLDPNVALPQYNTKGTLDSNNKPNAVDGWEWVGWGVNNGGTWTYYFADETETITVDGSPVVKSIIDYNGSTGTHLTPADMPATVTSNIEFVGFYKALQRTLVFSVHEYDSSVSAGTESIKEFADDPQPALADGVASTYPVRTGQNATMLNTSQLARAGYTLTGWTDGTNTYAPGSTNQFRMPDGPTTQTVYLYPVFNFAQVVVNYAVHSDSTGMGDVDKYKETLNSATETLKGSNPVAAPGYAFDYWTVGTDTTHLTTADGLQADGKLIPVGASGTLTYYVHFKAKTYDITLVKNLDPVGTKETLPETTSFTGKKWTDTIALGEATRYGYTFTGWDVYDSDDWAAYAADPENVTKPTAIRTGVAAGNPKVSAIGDATGSTTKLTLVPTWTARAYKVIFNDGKTTGTGTVSGMPYDPTFTRDCEFESNDINASNPTRDGYEFDGWANSVNSSKNVAKNVTTLTYSALVDSEDDTVVTLTAIWKAKAHTLTYVKTEGDTWSATPSNYPAGDPMFTGDTTNGGAAISTKTDETITLRTGTAISRTGAKLMGWTWTHDGTSTEYRFIEGVTLTFTMPDDDVELTPIWEEFGDYNVYFLPGAEGVLSMPGDRENIAFSTDNINMTAPKRPGWTFDGWSSSVSAVPSPAAGTGKKYADLVNNNDSIKSVTLTATWKQSDDYEVTFIENAGGDDLSDMPANQTGLKWTDTVTTLQDGDTNPGRAGYIFEGWTILDSEDNVLGNTDTTYFTAGTALFSELAQGQDLPERHHLKLRANWSAKTFKVLFEANKPAAASGTVSGMPSENPVTGLNFGDTVTVPALTLAGYQFKGWTNSVTSAVIGADDYLYSALTANDDSILQVVLTAKWEANPHYLTYNIAGDTWSTNPADYPSSEPADNGATNPTAAIKTKTDAIIDLRGASTAKRPGSTLKGWSVYEPLVGEKVSYRFEDGDVTFKMPDHDVELIPIWEEDEDYNVYFFPGDSEGATKVDMSTMPENQINIKYSATDIDTTGPTRAGYIFDGWANDSGTGLGATVTSVNFANLVTSYTTKTVKLTAKWIKDTNYKVTYVINVPDGSSSPYTGTVPANVPSLGFDDTVKQTALNSNDREGFDFKGWKITNDADGSELGRVTSGYADTIYSTIVSGNANIRAITFTAMWEGTPYKVTYHKQDGTWVTVNITDEGQASPDLSLTRKTEQDVDLRLANTMKRDGYTLVGWANGTDNTASGYVAYRFTATTSFSMPSHDVDLYPLWDAKTYTIIFVEKPASDTGSRPVEMATMPDNPQTGEYSSTFTYGAPTREGYDFGGWDVFKTSEYDANPAAASLLIHVGEGTGTYASLAGDPDIDSLTMVAIWTPKKLGVTYVLNVADNASWVKSNIKDAGKDTPSKLISYETDETVNLREADTVSRAGYALIGWKDSNSPSVTPNEYLFDADGHASFDMPAKNVILYAIWQIKDGYTVTFDGNAPTTDVAPGVVIENVPPDQPIAPDKLTWEGSTSKVDTHSPTFIGYTFKGWDVYGSDGIKISTTPLIGPLYYFNTLALTDTPEHEHLTLKAVWEISRDYNVYFKDGVEAGDTPVTVNTMPVDQTGITYVTVVDYHAPSRIGYTFDGWDVADITVETDIQAMPAIAASDAGTNPYYVLAGNNSARKKLELTARWIEKTGYNVHFVDKPASDTGVTPVDMGTLTDYIDIAWDDDVYAWPAPTRTGYDFVHWAVTNTTDPDNVVSIGTATAGQYKYSVLARERTDDTIMDITMTAIWKAHEWKVTYVNTSTIGTGTWMKANITDAGKNTPDAPVTYAVDTTIDLRDATTLVISGYKLVGWQEGETSPTNIYKFADGATSFIMPDRDVNLYPIWEPKEYKVYFEANKPAEATDPSQVVTGMPVTQWEPSDAQYPMTWDGEVKTDHPTLVGYEFTGWIIENASETGALTGLLNGTTYTFGALALTDTLEHETIKLIAQWRPASYRVNYVDPIDGTGTAIATPVLIATDDTKLWNDTVDNSDPWTISTPSYTGKSSDDWHFNGWTVLDATTNTYVAINSLSDLVFKTLAARENMTVADVATINPTPALVLYASWTRRVPFVVDFMKRDGAGSDTLEDSQTFVGLDGQNIETTVVDEISTTWKDYVLNTVGPNHKIAGYEYSYTISAPYVKGTLDANAAETLHVKLIYTQLADYTIVYDANPGALVADPTQHTATKGNLTWESAGSTFPPTDSDWFYIGHKIDGWTYGPTGVEYTFDGTVTFEQIAKAIYGTVDGSEGRDADGDGTIAKPVTIYAKWIDRNDYKVVYDNNYAVNDDIVKSGITDGRFLERVADATYTPAAKENVGWSAVDIEPTNTDDIKKPGVKDGKELYEIEGWNYLSKDGVQKPAEGKSFAEIFADMYDSNDPENDSIRTITLYARYKEISIKLTYTPVLADDDGNILSMGGSAAGTVSRTLETPDVVTGTILGSTATPNRGYHFIGWRRLSDNVTIYTSEAIAAMGLHESASGKAGFNVMPDGLGGATLLLAAQNADDGYWHDEEYLALFVQNETAILHYDKNAEDATGYIADVEAPYETLIDLSDGSGYSRKYWTLVSWNTKPDGTGITYALGETGWEMPQGETTLYAQWVKNKASLTYYPGGEGVTGIPDGITDEWGTSHPISTDKPKRDHYTFKGWNTKEDGTGTWYYGGEYIELPGDGMPLYAQWEINKYTVSIDPGPYTGGKVTYPDGGKYTVEHGGYLPEGYVTADPIDGYRVVGWRYTMTDEYGNVTTGIIDDPSKLQIIGNVTFQAIFEEIPEEPTREPSDGAGVPRTGDDQMLVIYAGAVVLAMIILVIAARRRREEEEE